MSYKLVLDEHGVEWTIKSKTVPNKGVLALRRAGVDTIVLPRVYLITGTLPDSTPALCDAGYAPPSSGSVPPFSLYVRQVRMLDCIDVLKEL